MSNFVYNHLEFKPTQEQIDNLPEHMDYALQIYNREIPSCEIAYHAIQRCIYEHCYADEIFDGKWKFFSNPGRQFIKFFEDIPVYEGPKAGIDKHKMLPWQKFLMAETEGWRAAHDTSLFRFNEVVFEVGKGAGKSTMIGFRMLYALLYGYDNAEYFSIATAERQARDSWKHALKAAFAMQNTVTRNIGTSKTVLENKKNFSTFEFLSGSPTSLDGKNSAILLVDESASISNDDVIDKIKLSQGKQHSGRTFFTTHPQWDTTTYYYEMRENIVDCLRGEIPMNPLMERTFAIVYQLDDKNEIEDESTWVKAQPGIGIMPSYDWMKAEYERRKNSPTKLRSFQVYNFGVWQKNETAWLDPDIWNLGKLKVIIKDGKAYIGVDLAERQDLAGVVIVFPKGNREWHCEWKFWTCQEVIDDLKPDLKARFLEAEESGILEIHPGKYIQQGPIIRYVKELCDKYDVETVAVDPKFARTASGKWTEAGIQTMNVYQGHASMADSVDIVESRIVSGEIKHDGNPFLKWQLSNCEAIEYPDGVKAIRSSNRKAHEVIDGFAALLTAARAVVEPYEPELDIFVHVG